MTFNTPLDVRTMASHMVSRRERPARKDEKDYVLLGALIYQDGELGGDGAIVRVPLGFVTDLASVPRLLWAVIAPFGLHASAAVLHDWLYRSDGARRRFSRRQADRMFREAMVVSGTPKFRAWLMWLAVRSPFGFLAYHRSSRRVRLLDVS